MSLRARPCVVRSDLRTAKPIAPAAKGAKDVTHCYKHGIVFLHLDEDHVTVSHFRRNYLCPALRAATRRVATRVYAMPGPIAFPVTQRQSLTKIKPRV